MDKFARKLSVMGRNSGMVINVFCAILLAGPVRINKRNAQVVRTDGDF